MFSIHCLEVQIKQRKASPAPVLNDGAGICVAWHVRRTIATDWITLFGLERLGTVRHGMHLVDETGANLNMVNMTLFRGPRLIISLGDSNISSGLDVWVSRNWSDELATALMVDAGSQLSALRTWCPRQTPTQHSSFSISFFSSHSNMLEHPKASMIRGTAGREIKSRL